jgi:hypothetical protein
MWFTKGDITRFDLDAVRVPQKYPGKRFYKGPRKGEWSGNPLGKNPGDVWEIPNVKSKHPEKTEHPCQFPTALARRFIRALTAEGDLVIDPYLGSGTTAVAALMEGRNFIGGDISPAYFGIANRRLADLSNGNLKFREDIPPRAKVWRIGFNNPSSFQATREKRIVPMTDGLALATPEKRLFISLITRDIGLADAILDLMDNAINSIISEGRLELATPSDYIALLARKRKKDIATIDIDFNDKSFTMKDTAGGISYYDAENSVFRFGRPLPDEDEENDDTLSVYGIGMKRAIFKDRRPSADHLTAP